jgi:hypothetical protein
MAGAGMVLAAEVWKLGGPTVLDQEGKEGWRRARKNIALEVRA